MKLDDLKLPVFTERLPPPPAGTLDEYYDFILLLAELRPLRPSRDPDCEHNGPRFTLHDDENP